MNNTEVTMAHDTQKQHTLDAHRVALESRSHLGWRLPLTVSVGFTRIHGGPRPWFGVCLVRRR